MVVGLTTTYVIGNIIHKDEEQWILTVLAIWTDTAKQFMRTSAEKVLHTFRAFFVSENEKNIINMRRIVFIRKFNSTMQNNTY
jgi:hypothetical protein